MYNCTFVIVANHVQNVRSSPSFIGGSYAESVTVALDDVPTQDRRAGSPAPRFEKKKMGLVFVNFHCIYANTLILVNMQCLQYVYYSLLF